MKRHQLWLLAVIIFLLQCIGGYGISFTGDEVVPDKGINLYGEIKDNEGNPVPNVVVSDGYTCTATNSKGLYQLVKNKNSQFVFYSTPSAYKIETKGSNDNNPCFYARIDGKSNQLIRHDFVLNKLSNSENNFTLVCIGDPQCANSVQTARFKNETVKDLNHLISTVSAPCYGIALGDVVWNTPEVLPAMNKLIGSIHIPVFVTVGNHDKSRNPQSKLLPRSSDDFKSVFGPTDYSFNRGSVHFISLDNIMYSNSEDYKGGITDEQLKWVKNDLSYVSKDKMVIVYYHIPVSNAKDNNEEILRNLLKDYKEVHLMAGHTHTNKNYIFTSAHNMYEHIHGTACGAFWHSTMCCDGTPNGYEVYEIDGNRMKNWYFKAVNYDKGFQIRLYHGDASFGGQYGNFSFGLGKGSIVANVWNADRKWKIEVFEDGARTGKMKSMAGISYDAWAVGYHVGVLHRKMKSFGKKCSHLYTYTLKNPGASRIEVKATDEFGNVYTQNSFTSDFSSAISY
ncbi:MAG: calcineurin-like phosphoesterase family protein [Bacteroidota bacterium]|nr:calcineurin-like phosphoesterase family protein [Bacteroidota bacterium]